MSWHEPLNKIAPGTQLLGSFATDVSFSSYTIKWVFRIKQDGKFADKTGKSLRAPINLENQWSAGSGTGFRALSGDLHISPAVVLSASNVPLRHAHDSQSQRTLHKGWAPGGGGDSWAERDILGWGGWWESVVGEVADMGVRVGPADLDPEPRIRLPGLRWSLCTGKIAPLLLALSPRLKQMPVAFWSTYDGVVSILVLLELWVPGLDS